MKIFIVFEFYVTLDDSGNEEEFRLFHYAFSTEEKAEAYIKKTSQLPGNELTDFIVEETVLR